MSVETPHSLAEKKFLSLQPLTPGSTSSRHHDFTVMQLLTDYLSVVHGYSLLRTQLNNAYFHDIFDVAEQFDVHLESHRAY